VLNVRIAGRDLPSVSLRALFVGLDHAHRVIALGGVVVEDPIFVADVARYETVQRHAFSLPVLSQQMVVRTSTALLQRFPDPRAHVNQNTSRGDANSSAS
jgi:hypothetical protein